MTISDKEIQKLNKTLNKLSRSALPQTTRYTLNEMADKCRATMRAEIKSSFINRNKWTVNSIRTVKARQYNIEDMESQAGSIAPYMRTQQDGGRVKPKSGKKKPIAMNHARVSGSRYKVVQKKYKMRYLNLGGNVFYAKKTKKSRKPGIYIEYKDGKLRKLQDLSNSQVQIDKKDWATKPFKRVANQRILNKIYYKQAQKQIDRLIK